MANCTTKITAGLDPSCEALDKIGGVNKTVYFGNLDEITFTTTVDGNIDSVTLASSPQAYLYKFIGKTKKNSSTAELQVGENTNTWKQSAILKLYYFNQSERDAIDALVKADDLVAFIQTEAGTIEVLGWEKGIRAESATGSTGVLIQDDTSVTVTISGEETNLPKVLKLDTSNPGDASYITDNITLLDALC